MRNFSSSLPSLNTNSHLQIRSKVTCPTALLKQGGFVFGFFIACQKREGDLQSSFISKPQRYPPSCRGTEVRFCEDCLTKCLENEVNSALSYDPAGAAAEVFLLLNTYGEVYLATGWEQMGGYFSISKVPGKDQTVWPDLIQQRSENWKWQFIEMSKFLSLWLKITQSSGLW